MVQMALLRKGASRRWNGDFLQKGFLTPSTYNLSRAFSTKLFVGGLSFHTTEEMLRKAFSEHGDVTEVKIITDRESGRSRGFGFVTFNSESEAEAAKAKMSSQLLDGRFIRVDMASARPPMSASPRPFGNNSSSSGFSFGSGGTRPPVVEDWGPLPSYSFQNQGNYTGVASPSTNNPNQGSTNAFNGPGQPSTVSLDSTLCTAPPVTSFADRVAPPPSATFQQVASTLAFQNNDSASVVQNNTASVTGPTDTSSIQNDINATQHTGIQSEAGSGQILAIENATERPSQSGTSDFGSRQGADASITSQADLFKSSVKSKSPSSSYNMSTEKSSSNHTSSDPNSRSYNDHSESTNLKKSSGKIVCKTSNWQSKVTEGTWQCKLTEEAIPPPKGPVYNFGLGAIPDSPPPLDSGANPTGGFSTSVCLDGLQEAEPVRLPYSIFTARTLPPLDLPWLTPEADNWSEIGKPPRRIEDSPYSPFSPDLKDDPEFWWDPYDFDPDTKALKEALGDNPFPPEEPLKLRLSKEPEAEQPPAVANAAAS